MRRKLTIALACVLGLEVNGTVLTEYVTSGGVSVATTMPIGVNHLTNESIDNNLATKFRGR